MRLRPDQLASKQYSTGLQSGKCLLFKCQTFSGKSVIYQLSRTECVLGPQSTKVFNLTLDNLNVAYKFLPVCLQTRLIDDMTCMGVCRTIQHLGPLHHVESLIKLEVLLINLPWFPNVFFLFSKPKTEHSNKTVFDLFSFSYFIYRPACPYLLLLDARHPQLWCHS